MTAAELIKQLKKLPPETPVIMASDEEGNHAYELWALFITQEAKVILWPGAEVEFEQDDEP